MYNHMHVFDFSFVASGRRRRTKPQLVFTLNKKYLTELTNRLQTLSSWWMVGNYLGVESDFVLPIPDLFGNTEFGYKRCGLVTYEEGEVSLRLELSQERLSCVTATIHLLTMALCVPYESEGVRSNRSQQIDLSTVCDSKRFGYGHAVNGYVSAEVRAWLRKQSAHLTKEKWIVEGPSEIATAMRQAWSAIVPRELRKWASACSARITKDGRFILECMGDACDVAIYPNSLEDVGDPIQFSCHNLDQARQQVTLLAGLAKLCELVRKDAL